VEIPEGEAAAFTVAFAMDPGRVVTVTVARESGDPDIEITSGATVTLSPSTYATGRAVSLHAREDPDSIHGEALFVLTAPGFDDGSIIVREVDADAASLTYFVDGLNGDDTNHGQTEDTALQTIGRAVELAGDGDTIVVADGTYENAGDPHEPVLDFHGKAITVRSRNGPQNCILAGGDYVVDFHSGEERTAVVAGFTVTGGDPGGGIRCDHASPTIERMIIAGNWSEYNNGAVFLRGSRARIAGTLVRDNASFGACAGIYCVENSAAVITNTTIAANQVGGIWCDGTSVAVVTNCILWNNNADYDIHNATATYTCLQHAAPGTGNISDDPLLADPAGGDCRLTAGSPAVDAGTVTEAPSIDLDGNQRPCGAALDMGAYEWGACTSPPHPFQRGDVNADARLNVADAIVILGHLFAGRAAPPCMKSADANDDSQVNIADTIFLLGYLFGGAREPPPPFGVCGKDPTEDMLDCVSFPPCD
jgi:hypothetical protein